MVRPTRSSFHLSLALAISSAASTVLGQGLGRQESAPIDYSKPPAFKEAEDAAKGFKVPKGMKMDVFAAEPQLVNPVAICTDEKGRIFVVETFRYRGNGTIDMRNFQEWLDDDLAARTVEDRVAWIKKNAGDKANDFTLDSDQVRMLQDKDGDGKADVATIYAGDFHGMADGLAAGVLARKGQLYLTNIPSLYSLQDTKGDGKADVKKELSTGYGVHFQLLGHDLHGLVKGPDGKLYFSVGDRGCHVITKEGKVLDNPDSGAVFRCDWDGSNLEMIHTGLRNPQELAFDQYGNLFTADNNCDAGDMARWVYIVEGGETGWRMGYQWITSPNTAGPWMAEKLWHLDNDHPAAWSLPPLAHVGPGPSGLAYYPGTGLGDQFKDHFFMCDFRGGTNSGVWEYVLKPRGAAFEMAAKKQFVWNLLPVDIEFAVDGGMYIGDWVNGWARPMKGRVWKLTDQEAMKSPFISETRQLIAEGMEKRPTDELVRLLAHPDQRIRIEAQYEVANRSDAVAALHKRLGEDNEQLARIHSIWALGQIARKPDQAKVLEPIAKLLDDGDSEIRAQAHKILGDAKFAGSYDVYVRHLKDETSRVRFFAAMAVGKVAKPNAAEKVVQMIRENNDRDAYLRHAGVMALKMIHESEKEKKALEAAAKDESPSVRLAALMVMRRNKDAGIARFLDDAQPLLVEEAARAINDELIEGGVPPLAAVIAKPNLTRPVWLRSINANLRMGGQEQASAVAKFAADEKNGEDARAEALWALANWAKPPKRDRVMGLIRPLPDRDSQMVAEVAKPIVAKIATAGPAKVRVGAINLIQKLAIDQEVLPGIVQGSDVPVDVRVAALQAMEALKHPQLTQGVKTAFEQGVKGDSAVLRREAIGVYMRMPDAAQRVGDLFNNGSVADRKAILESLGTSEKGVGDSILGGVMDQLLAGTLPAALQLDLLEAAAKSKSPEVAEKLKQFEAKRDSADAIVGKFGETFEGGDVARGRKIFFEKGSVACLRCHKIGTEAVVVGPDLSAPAISRDRRHLVESIVNPNAKIAQGFETTILKLKSNVTVGGIVKKETDKELILVDPNEGEQEIDKEDIVSRTKGLSAMPEKFDTMLTKRELRDLVEFLATLKPGEKIEPQQAGHGG
jgi:quinoprotein glucose dehydrogenase